jgi:nicotinamidase-related amidase
MKEKVTLVVVDFQYDFCLLGAPLYVPGSDKAVAIGESIKLTPTDGLGISNSDLDQIGAKSYNDVDRVLQTLVCPASPENDRVQDALTVEIGPEIIDKIIKRRSNSRFKREKSPIYISRERYE